jgi:dihydrofolate reductase
MRKLKLEMQVSVDGFTAGADGDTRWMVWNWTENWPWNDRLRTYHNDLTLSSDCTLLSRKMAEEGFCDHWERVSQVTSNPPSVFAKHIVDTRKVVCTTTLTASRWKNTELVTGGLVDEVTRLQAEKGKDILAYGGPTFASSLLSAGLIAKFHFFVNPSALGQGKSLFQEVDHHVRRRLVRAPLFDCGVVVLEYTLER